MKKTIKLISITLAAIIAVVLIAVIVLPFVINPNDYKPQIIELVKKQTGRDLKIPGDIELSVFPWLGVNLGEVELSNASGFGSQPFARVKAVDVRVQLLPLLKKDIQVGSLMLDGLQLDLQRKKNGRSNWDDLVAKPADPSQQVPGKTQPAGKMAIASLAVGSIKVRNAQLNWRDELNQQDIRIESLDLETSPITVDEPVRIKLATRFKGSAPAISGQLEVSSQARFKVKPLQVTLSDLDIESQLQGKDLPGDKLDVKLKANSIAYNQGSQRLEAKGLQLASLGMQFYSDATVTQLDKQPRYQASLASDPFSLKTAMSQLGIALPASADPNALSKVQLSVKLTGDTRKVSVNPVTVQLDDSSLNGHLQVENFQRPAIRYALSLDHIDADRYLPENNKKAAGKKTTATPATAASQGGAGLPVDMLRSLDLKGDIKVGKLKLTGLHSEKILVSTQAKNGVIRLHPLQADLYKGQYRGDVSLDVRGKTPVFSMDESLSNVNIGPMIKDLWKEDRVEGTANLSAKLTARGTEPAEFRRTLNGNASFQFKDGVVKGINLGAYQHKLQALIDKKPVPSESGPNETAFANIQGTVQVTNGLAKNSDLRATLPFARIQGNGEANLASETVDYTLYSKFTSEIDIKQGKTYQQIDKPPLPVRIHGPLTSPTISVDYNAVIKELAKHKIEQKKEEAKTKAKEKLKQQLDEKLNIDDKLKDLLKF